MTLYQIIKKAAEILAPKNSDALFDYIIHSMDDDWGFLRTRYCYWEKTLTDRKYANNEEPRILLIAMEEPYRFDNECGFYQPLDDFGILGTLIKMQLFYCDLSNDADFNSKAEWSAQLGYNYPVRINLTNGTAEYLERMLDFFNKNSPAY